MWSKFSLIWEKSRLYYTWDTKLKFRNPQMPLDFFECNNSKFRDVGRGKPSHAKAEEERKTLLNFFHLGPSENFGLY